MLLLSTVEKAMFLAFPLNFFFFKSHYSFFESFIVNPILNIELLANSTFRPRMHSFLDLQLKNLSNMVLLIFKYNES